MQRHITINGELGSGKSSVARRLAESFKMRLVSTGDIHRSIAASLRLTTLETNLRAEHDEMIDAKVDGVTKELAGAEYPIVFDSRLAWKLVPGAFKVHLTVDPAVSARRLHRERHTDVEGYASVEEARKAAEERYQSEYRRFLTKYDADMSFLKNYHLVVDTSDASIDEVVAQIESAYHADSSRLADLRVSPVRLLPGRDPTDTIKDPRQDPGTSPGQTSIEEASLAVGYARPFFYMLDGLPAVSAAIRRGQSLITARLLAEAGEEVADGLSAEEYLCAMITPSWITTWEKENNLRFETVPDCAGIDP
jgi:CMP/dCMP kinase